MSGMPSMPVSCVLAFETTVTFTTAGVTRAARVSIARSSVNNAATLLSSSAAAAGVAAGAAFADFVKVSVATDPTTTTASTAAAMRFVATDLKCSIHIFIFFILFLSSCTTNYLVVKCKKIFARLNRVRYGNRRHFFVHCANKCHPPDLDSPNLCAGVNEARSLDENKSLKLWGECGIDVCARRHQSIAISVHLGN